MSEFLERTFPHRVVFWLAVLFTLIVSLTPHYAQSAEPWQLIDTRYCGDVKRDHDGRIARSASVVRAFRERHACPATGEISGRCPGWAVDHVIPLACGGCDAVANLQWLPDVIKSGPGTLPKDRWERKVYCDRP